MADDKKDGKPAAPEATPTGAPESKGKQSQRVRVAYRGPADAVTLSDGSRVERHAVVEVDRAALMAAWNAGHHLDEVQG